MAHPPSSRQREDLRQHLQAHPADVKARLAHSSLLQRAGRAEEALAELDLVAASHHTPHGGLQVARAQLLVALGRDLEAQTALSYVPEADRDATFHLFAARVARSRSDAAQVTTHYRASLANAASVVVATEYGAWLEESGRSAEALRVYDEQLRRGHGAVVLRLALLRLLRASGNHQRALGHIDQLLATAQMKAEYRLLRATTLASLARHREAQQERKLALAEAEAAYRRRPSTQRLALRGRARCENGLIEAGLKDLRQAAQGAPESPLIQEWLADARVRDGGAR